jgi:hypothetical protein
MESACLFIDYNEPKAEAKTVTKIEMKDKAINETENEMKE